jgi:hypothetical protein
VVLVEYENDGEESPAGGSKARKGSWRVELLAEAFEAGWVVVEEVPGIMRLGGREVAMERLLGGGPMEAEARFSAIDRVGEIGEGFVEVFALELLREWCWYGT